MPPPFALRKGLDDFQLCLRLEDCKGADGTTASALRFHETVSARVFIRSCVTDPEQERKLRLWLKGSKQIDDAGDVFEQVAALLATGQLVVASMAKAGDAKVKGILRGGQSSGSTRRQRENTPLQDEMARREYAVVEEDVIVLGETEPQPEKTWIELELVDGNGKPVPAERYKLTLPDGSVKWGRLDDSGKARIERLQPGTCQVTFPDRDEEVWEVE